MSTITQVDLPTLWPHQQRFIADVRKSIGSHRRTIACGITGFGKSRCAKWILGSALNREPKEGQSGKALFAVHRRGLVDNITQSFEDSPALPHGVIMSGCERMPGYRVQAASIDTLLSWYVDGSDYSGQTYDLIVYDECHSHHSKLRSFWDAHAIKRQELGLSESYLLGLSATPECEGLADLYRDIVMGPPAKDLQRDGFAAPFRYLCGKKGRLELLKKTGYGFTDNSVDEAMRGLQGDFIRDWKTHAAGRPTIGFFPRLSHAQEALTLLHEAGVEARYVDGNTPDDERRSLFYGLQHGYYQYLCNVGVVERGTDIPAASCIQLCTAIGSRVRYRQMVGRGCRIDDGKTETIVIDHGGNVQRHGLWEDEIPWCLDNTTKASKDSGVRPTIECPQCSAIYRGGLCRYCGYEPTQQERKSQSLVFDGSELQEYKPAKKQSIPNDPEKLFVGCLYRAGKSRRTWKQACGMFCGIAKKNGLNSRVPKTFVVGGHTYQAIPYGHPDGARLVSELYPFIRS